MIRGAVRDTCVNLSDVSQEFTLKRAKQEEQKHLREFGQENDDEGAAMLYEAQVKQSQAVVRESLRQLDEEYCNTCSLNGDAATPSQGVAVESPTQGMMRDSLSQGLMEDSSSQGLMRDSLSKGMMEEDYYLTHTLALAGTDVAMLDEDYYLNTSVSAVKYLYKYVYKGVDQACMAV